jgi:hypothetical protein
VAVAAEAQFSIPASLIAKSAFDYAELSPVGVARIAEGVSHVPENWHALFGTWQTFLLVLFGSFVGLLGLRVIAKFRSETRAPSKVKVKERVLEHLDFANRQLPWWRAVAHAAGGAIGFSILGTAAQALFILAVWVVLILGILMLSVVPLIGYGAGKKYITDYVVMPSACSLPAARVDRLSSVSRIEQSHASCVAICKDGELAAQGRVILSTSSAVLLYDPDSGDAVRVPADGAVVKSIAYLESSNHSLCVAGKSASSRSGSDESLVGDEVAGSQSIRGRPNTQ